MALRKFLFLDSTEGSHVEENPTADWAQLGQLIVTGLSGVGLNASGSLLSNVATPVSSTDAATKGYVDASAGSAVTKQIEVDCGSVPVAEMTALFSDIAVTPSSRIMYALSGQTPTGKDADELLMDQLMLVVQPLSGQLQVYLRGLEGYIHDKFKVVYTVG